MTPVDVVAERFHAFCRSLKPRRDITLNWATNSVPPSKAFPTGVRATAVIVETSRSNCRTILAEVKDATDEVAAIKDAVTQLAKKEPDVRGFLTKSDPQRFEGWGCVLTTPAGAVAA